MKTELNKQITKVSTLPRRAFQLTSYMFLITIYVILITIRKLRFLKPLEQLLEKIIYQIDKPKENNVYKIELIDLAMQNMAAKKNRTVITIGGMTVGIASIVFLVSIGYGLETLVINRVARLEEMRQAEVATLPGSNLLLNDETLQNFRDIPNVDMVLPQISVVGKVNYNNSLTDTAVYGVNKDYLEQSAISPVTGQTFENNLLSTEIIALKETYIEEQSEDTEILPSGWVEIDGESDSTELAQISKVIFPDAIKDREIVVNRAFLKVLNLKESKAIDETFSISFIATNWSLEDNQEKLESTSVEYTIIGITPDELTPLVYIPFEHLKALGVNNYSQAKIVVNEEKNLESVRNAIESQGFLTASVTDTVEQINSLFRTATIALASIGTIALFVASLGMFNTLTVSLLERIREIGLLKTMGMKSNEIRDLFLAESMIMGSLGGFLGLIFGLATGKVIELFLSIYAVSKGVGSITIVDIPIPFALLVIFLSFLVGVLTGIYPAKKATKISALNALRYE